MEQPGTEAGNTRSASVRSRGWCFTLNNPDPSAQKIIEVFNETDCVKFAFQLEVGKSGTPHFQGFVYYKNPRAFSCVKQLIAKAHWEKMQSLQDSIHYCMKPWPNCLCEHCSKGSDRIDGPWAKGVKIPAEIKILSPTEMKWWQQDLTLMLASTPDDRKIVWYYDPIGGAGKTSYAKFACIKMGAIYVSGKTADVKYALTQKINSGVTVPIVIFDIPRTMEKFISYDAIESVKNGIFFSTKYESGMCIYPIPHVIIFSNFYPNEEALSEDRWDIRTLSIAPVQEMPREYCLN